MSRTAENESDNACVPEPWTRVPLGDICEIVRGVSYKKDQASDQAAKGKVPILRATNIQDGLLVLDSDLVYVPADVVSEEQMLRAGDIVVATSSGSKHLVGKTAQVRDAWVGSFGAFCAALRPKVEIDHRYLGYFFGSKEYKDYITKKALGVNINNLRRGDLEQISVPVAPLDQQKRIVAEIEKQFSRLDEAVANLKRVKANLKRYKAAVLKAAVEGRLVETEAELARREGRCFETGEQLLQRVLETRRSQWKGKGKYKEPAAPDTTELLELPKGWVWASVDQLVAHLTDGDHQPPPQTDEGIPFLVIGNVRNGEIDFTETRHVGVTYYESLDPYRKPKLGDLLYTLVGSYGIPVRVKTDVPFCIQRHMAILRPHESSPMEYLTLAMASNDVFKQATAVATGTAQKTVPLAGLRRIAISLPPPAEQLRIVAELERRLSTISGSEAEADVNLKRADRLRQSILEKAFSGELIPEDSNVEPVSALLARVRIDEAPKQATETPKASTTKVISKEFTVADLLEALKGAGDWISAQEAFRRCGVGVGADTDAVERLYAELRDYVRPGIVEVERRGEEDWLRASPSKGA